MSASNSQNCGNNEKSDLAINTLNFLTLPPTTEDACYDLCRIQKCVLESSMGYGIANHIAV